MSLSAIGLWDWKGQGCEDVRGRWYMDLIRSGDLDEVAARNNGNHERFAWREELAIVSR